MTDEQLDEIDQAMSDGAVTWYQLVRLTAETRRLRELERACKRLFWRTEHGERYMPAQSLYGTNEREAIATIGRLLEGEKAQ